ncbi:hypothetical protein SUGI_0701730 [Cryptomeria japonica]|nr:hypothetical protein SUGI_0701730 [Cryptomeria japonica]
MIYRLLPGSEIPTARYGTDFAFCASPEGTIYIAGGFTKIRPGHALREAAVYKVDEDKWELLPEMHQEIDSCRGVFIEGIFYVIGRDNRTQRFDPTTRVWTTIVNMSWNHIFWNNFLYAFGRLSLFTAWNGIEQYDWEGNVWTKLEPLPHKLGSVRATVWSSDRIFLCGTDIASFYGSNISYMYKPGAALEERWIYIENLKFLCKTDVTSVATIEI